jgi:hypothetical protein
MGSSADRETAGGKDLSVGPEELHRDITHAALTYNEERQSFKMPQEKRA